MSTWRSADLVSRAYLTGRPLESAETAEEAMPALRDPELASLLVDVRGVLIEAYRALGELESALTRNSLSNAPTGDTRPGSA